MAIEHHPREETLARLAAGRLPAGPSVVVRAHVEGCPACAALVARLEAVGGALLEAQPPAALAPDALARTLARIDAPQSIERADASCPPRRPRHAAALPEGVAAPDALRDCIVGPWRWIGAGKRLSRIRAPSDRTASLIMLRVGPGLELTAHDHTGTEYTQVLCGSFTDERGRYVPGDLDEADPEVRHRPVVDPEGECICLVAIDGRMRPDDLIARLMQPIIGL